MLSSELASRGVGVSGRPFNASSAPTEFGQFGVDCTEPGVGPAAAAGLAGDDAAEDDDVSVYADEKGAVVITHDREFSVRRRRNTFGRHVRLRCLEPMAVEVLADHLDELVRLLEEMAVVVIEVRPDSLIVHPPAWK